MYWFKKILANSNNKTETALGIETLGGIMTPIINEGENLPIRKAQIFSTAEDNQPIVSIRIMQGKKDMALSDCILIGEFEVLDIMPAPRGVPQIEVAFDVNEKGAVNVTARDKSTGKKFKYNVKGEKILSKKDFDDYADETKDDSNEEGESSNGVGTGFFVDNKGHIITNFHVVSKSKNKTKILFEHEEIKAKLISYDENLDLALIKIKTKNKDFIKFSNNTPKKAQNILVAGYPYGKAISDDLKITSGTINSLKGILNDTSMLQIDATINPGNSGGPIVDKESGCLVGVATAKLSKDFTKKNFGEESENTNFGIKSSQVKDFLDANNVEYKITNQKLKVSELEKSTVFIFS